MGKGIKTRVAEKGIKAIDKAAVASERMKEAYIRTRDKADHSLYNGVGEVLDHVENTAVPALRCLPNLHGYISDLLVYRIEHPGQVSHNAAYQHFLEPLSKRVQQKIHTVRPPFSPSRLLREGQGFSRDSLDGKQTGEQGYEDHADHGDASASHELLHALAFY